MFIVNTKKKEKKITENKLEKRGDKSILKFDLVYLFRHFALNLYHKILSILPK